MPPETISDRLVPDLLDNIEAAALAITTARARIRARGATAAAIAGLCPASRELRYEPVEYYEDDED